MAPKYAPRSRRRRSSCCPSLCCCLVLAWAVIFVGSNIARVLMLPDFFVRPQREEIVKTTTYYDILGVGPLVADSELKTLRRKHLKESHPDKTRNSPEANARFHTETEAFDTLQNGWLRCQYDKKHGIKGKFGVRSCGSAFPEESRRRAQKDNREVWQEMAADGKVRPPTSSDLEDEQPEVKVKVKPLVPKPEKVHKKNQASGKKSRSKPLIPEGEQLKVEVKVEPVAPESDKVHWHNQASGGKRGPESSDPEDEKLKVEVKVEQVMPETEKPSSRKFDSKPGQKGEDKPLDAEPEARRAIPVITVNIEPEHGGDRAILAAVARVWKIGIVPGWIATKAMVAESAVKVWLVLDSCLDFFRVVPRASRV